MRVSSVVRPYSRPVVLTGPGISRLVPETVAQLCRKSVPEVRATVVTGPGFDTRTWSAGVFAALRPPRPAPVVHAGRTTPASVAELIQALRANHGDVVVAIGGGTVIDAAKAAVALSGRG